MSNIEQQIDNLKTLQESYDSLAAASDAYNTGKVELAVNITAKGVQASADETLPELAAKVGTIQQTTYEIDGGDLYEKQMYGGATTVTRDPDTGVYHQNGGSLWNLYEVMACLLSDPRFVDAVNYIDAKGILLAEYFKGYDTIQLLNVGAGGAYFTCDGDLYFTDKGSGDPHVWHDNDNGMMNRWVAYLFAGEGTDYTIPSTGLCPRSIHIGRKVGTINCSVAGRIREIVVTDGNELYGTNFTSTQVWQQEVVVNNTKNIDKLINGNNNIVSLHVKGDTFYYSAISNTNPNLTAVFIDTTQFVHYRGDYASYVLYNSSPLSYIKFREGSKISTLTVNTGTGILTIDGLKSMVYITASGAWNGTILYSEIRSNSVEEIESIVWSGHTTLTNLNRIYFPKTKKFGSLCTGYGGSAPVLKDLVVGPLEYSCNCSSWNPATIIADADALAELNANIRNHIAANVADGNNTLTFTVSTNLYNNLEQATLDAFAAKHWLVAGA